MFWPGEDVWFDSSFFMKYERTDGRTERVEGGGLVFWVWFVIFCSGVKTLSLCK